MYKNKAVKNIIISILFSILILISGLISRIYIVKYLGNEITGLYSLFVSILGFLAIAELGVGSAIIFSMYKPIIEKDINKVTALYYLYKKIYFVVFLFVFLIGLVITPLLPYLAKEFTIGNEIYITYILFLLSTSITYLYAYKSSFINAHMDNYITTSIRSIFQIIEQIVQIIVIIITKSFILFLVIHLLSNVLQWLATNIIFKLRYSKNINDNKLLSNDVKKEVTDKTKAMFLHKIGGLLVNTTDSLIISAVVGVALLGIYSNYTLIVTSMVGILSLIFSSVTTIIGHAFAKHSKETLTNSFQKIYLVNYILGLLFFLGFYAISSELITLLFNENVLLNNNIVLILTVNYFVQFMRTTTLTFRNASGTFYNDRYKPLIEGILNLILSLILVQFFGISGVLIATIITNITITHIVEPYVLYKHAFDISPKKYYIFNYLGILLFVLLVLVFRYIPIPITENNFLDLLIKGSLSVFITTVVVLLLYILNKTIRDTIKGIIKEGLSLIKRKQDK